MTLDRGQNRRCAALQKALAIANPAYTHQSYGRDSGHLYASIGYDDR